MFKILEKTSALLAVIAALLLLFITFTIGYSILTRSLGLHAPVWTVQFNEYSLLWLTFLGTAWVLSRKGHVSIHLVYSRLGRKPQLIMSLLHSIMGFGLCGILFWYGWGTTWEHFRRNVIDVQPVDIPKAYVLAVIPLGFLLLSLQFLKAFYQALSRLRSQWRDEGRSASITPPEPVSDVNADEKGAP
ncbi:MAG: TRAP transporter small permease [Deltaproteobacteria bacterium]|nr:TRAP transporter small permease [Deltaproteobacteria bacterium]MBW2137179.1 TRAP transporter small permease [Deltaproteobacteria bacterium]